MGLIQNKVSVSQPNSHVVVKNAGGLRGLTGETGPQGPQGVPGEAATVTAGTTTTLPSGSNATVQNVGSTSAAIFNFGIPKGDKGDTGESGTAATISVGSTSTLPAGSSATVTNSGTSSAAVFDFGIPKGDKGDTGATGADGYSPSATVTKTGDTATITITDKDGTTTASISDGTTPTVNDGTLTIQKNGTTVQTFSADQASNVTANITVPTQFSDLSGTVSSSQIEDEAITTGSVSGTGTNITLAGTMEGGAIESVELNGDTEQTTYSGKNLCPTTSRWFWLNQAANMVGKLSGNSGVSIQVSQNTDYTISVKTAQARYRVGFVDSEPVNEGDTVTAYNGVNKDGQSVSVTVNSGTHSYLVVNVTDLTECMVEKGSTPTSFEPYVGGTASPNPDYPQEVQTVTGRQVVTISDGGSESQEYEINLGKNLFDINGDLSYGGYPISPTNNGDGTLTTTANYNSQRASGQKLSLEPNTTYTVSGKLVSHTGTGNVSVVEILSGTIGGVTVIKREYITTDGAFSYSVTTSNDVSKLWVSFSSVGADTQATFGDIQIERGSTATTYAPYITAFGKNLLNPNTFVKGRIDSGVVGYASDTSVLSNTTNTITFTTTASYRGAASGFISVDAEAQYMLQQQLQSGTTNYIDFYDTSKTWISRATSNPFTTPQDCGYVRVSYQGNTAGTYTITNLQLAKGSSATTYEPNMSGQLELCKIGTYQDYIYKSGEDWYVKKNIGKITLDGTETWTWNQYDVSKPKWARTTDYTVPAETAAKVMCSHFTPINSSDSIINFENSIRISANQIDFTYTIATQPADLTAVKTWLGNNKPSVYYALATPTDTQITNATLISELEGLLSATTYSGNTYITVSGDLASPLEVVAEADSKLAPDSVYGAAIKDGAVSVDKIADLKALADALAPYLNS